MILIVDSGSSKVDWVVLNSDFNHVLYTSTIGLNPNITNKETISIILNANKDLVEIKEKVNKVYFYGAGCSSPETNKQIEIPLSRFFKNATFIIENDLYSAAYSVYEGDACLVGIIGTGSNVCFFDGKNIRLEFSSLGYIMGDYGSGNCLGRNLLSAFAENKLPQNIKNLLVSEFNLSIVSIIENVYKKPFPNKYLAAFTPFILKNIEDSFINKMVYESFILFFKNYVLIFPEAKHLKLNLVGSISSNFKEILTKAALEMEVTIGKIIAKPIEGLVNFHKNHLK